MLRRLVNVSMDMKCCAHHARSGLHKCMCQATKPQAQSGLVRNACAEAEVLEFGHFFGTKCCKTKLGRENPEPCSL